MPFILKVFDYAAVDFFLGKNDMGFLTGVSDVALFLADEALHFELRVVVV